MQPDLSDEVIEVFDGAMDAHMQIIFGPGWRTMCHQSAKVAALALKILYPSHQAELRRVELIALMEGAGAFVHIGWADDPERFEDKIPAHFATAVGTAIYDPTFQQLRNAKTPLDLPPQPYFYAERFLADAPVDRQGFRWAGLPRSTGVLRIGYKSLTEAQSLPELPAQALMSDADAASHAQAVAKRFQKAHGHSRT